MTSDDATTLRARADQLQRRMSRGRCRLALRVAAQSLTPSPNAVPNLAEPSVIFVLINFFSFNFVPKNIKPADEDVFLICLNTVHR